MVEPSNGAPRDLQALLDGKVDTSVRYDDVTTFAKRRNNRSDGRESLRVDDAGLSTQEVSDVLFELNMYVCPNGSETAQHCGRRVAHLAFRRIREDHSCPSHTCAPCQQHVP